MSNPKDKQTMFAMMPGTDTVDGVPLLMFLIPDAALRLLEAGKSSDFDMTKIGIPLRVVIGRCRTYDHGRKMIDGMNAGIRAKVKDVTDVDIAFDAETKKPN